MTEYSAEEKEELVREFWRTHQGRLGATAGARKISESTGIPVNTIRGVQHRIYAPEERPWDLSPIPLQECPRCKRKARTQESVSRHFGWRRVKRGPKGNKRKVKRPQSYCRKCRTMKVAEARRRKREAEKRARAAAVNEERRRALEELEAGAGAGKEQ